jgi:NAD(P) transhydrogenase
MEQGRRAVCHALGVSANEALPLIPAGVYTIPEIASIGISEAEAIKAHGSALVGRARFEEIARGQIAAIEDGLLKLVVHPDGKRILGIQIVGEGASELIHVGQMAMLSGVGLDVFVDQIFNFPTLAETYRVAALDVLKQRR